jgi:hypothetical protein
MEVTESYGSAEEENVAPEAASKTRSLEGRTNQYRQVQQLQLACAFAPDLHRLWILWWPSGTPS